MAAFWLGEFTNSYTLAKMKLWTNGKWLWTRTVGSTIAGQFVDTTTVILIAFIGWTPWVAMLKMIISGYLFKVIYEAAATPITYWIVNSAPKALMFTIGGRISIHSRVIARSFLKLAN